MKPRIKFGLIVGSVSFLLTACVSMVIGVCGPVVSLLGGAISGYLAAKEEALPTQADGAKAGAIAGAISGGIALLGQFLGGILTLAVLPSIMESLGDAFYQQQASGVGYWAGGGVMMICIGLSGVITSLVTGAAGGYFGTQPQQNTSGDEAFPPPAA
ncbi:MAG: hypothetical protein GY755_12915 [Chloroflexi bacterium]|nr:hypothetical protein [Chloroflexota bacterium]